MPKSTLYVFLLIGVTLSVLLLVLRLGHQFNAMPHDVQKAFEVLGYGSPKNYAVLLVDREREPLLFLFTISEGNFEFKSVGVLPRAWFPDLKSSDFMGMANALVNKLLLSENPGTIDGVGFITSGAAGEIADAFNGLYVQGEQVTSSNLNQLMWSIANSEDAEAILNQEIRYSKIKFLTNLRSLLGVVRGVVYQAKAAVYFRQDVPFRKPCIGACSAEIFEYSGLHISFKL